MNKPNMTTIADEAAKVRKETGYYVPPYKLAGMVQAAGKCLKIFADSSFQCTYLDCKIILRLIERALETPVRVAAEENFTALRDAAERDAAESEGEE